MNSDRTDNYIGTFSPNDPSDMNTLDNIREMVRETNRILRENNKSYTIYVSCRTARFKEIDAYIYRRDR